MGLPNISPLIVNAMMEIILDKTITNFKNTFENGNCQVYALVCGSRILGVSSSYDMMFRKMNNLPEQYLRYSIIQDFNISYADFKKVKLLSL